jgi:sporulation protein YlmC with PRC-barrel domain
VRPIAANVLSTAEVRSPAGENVGKIVDVMLDTERSSVVYAVLAVGGVLGVGAKMLAIPPRNLKLALDGRCVQLDVDTATLEAADGIDRANLPEHAEPALRPSAPPGGPRADSHNQR